MIRFLLPIILCSASITVAGTIQPNENLIIDGLPNISTELIEQTCKYTDFHPILLLDVHPTTSQMLVKMRPNDGQVMQLHNVDANGLLTQITHFSDATASAKYQPTTGSYCVFNKDVNGAENHQNYRYDFDSGKITLLTDDHSRNTLGIWSHKGNRMAYSSNSRNGKDQDFYLIDPLNSASKQMIMQFSSGDGWFILDWSPDDAFLLAEEYISISETYLWSIDIKNNSRTLLTPKKEGEKVAYSHGRYSKDGQSLFLLTDKDCEFNTLARMDLDTGNLQYLTKHIFWDIDMFCLSPSGDQIAFVSNEAGFSKIHLITFSDNTMEEHIIKCIPQGVINGIKWDPQGDRLLFSLTSATTVTDVFAVDLNSETLIDLTNAQSAIDTKQFIEPELITWESFDGRQISGFLYRPAKPSNEKVPVRVIIHGGPEAQFRPEFLGNHNYFINELGVALLYPNIRGSTGYGKTFLQLADGLKRVDAYEDLNALLDWIKVQPGLDGNRIMVCGGSYGGHATLAVATRYNDKIACSQSIVGMSNLVTFLENTDIRRRDLRRAIYGDERIPEVRSFLESIAPINHADQITKPIFIVQGLKDPRVPYSEAAQMVNTLKKMKTPVWFLTAKNEGHGFSKKENVDFYFYATIEFIKRYLINDNQSSLVPPSQ